MGKRIFTLLTTFFIFANCFAGQISIQIVQHNLSLDYVSDQSLIIEDEILNGFFDRGFIVTNSAAAVSNSKEQDSDLFFAGFNEAFDGASDYFVQIKLYYDASKIKNVRDKTPCPLERIDMVMMNVKSGEKLIESSITGSKKNPGTDENIRLVSVDLISEISKVL